MALLTIDELKALAPSALPDAALEILLAAAEEAIGAAAGDYVDGYEVTGVTEYAARVRGELLALPRAASSITSVHEHAHTSSPAELDDSEYSLMPGGRLLRRVGAWWRPAIEVVFVPRDDLQRRKVAQANLVKLEIAFNPGLASQTVGAWTESYTLPGNGSYDDQRAAILAALVEPAEFLR